MRKPIIAGNWKMFKTRDEALAFIYAVNNDMPSIDKVDTVICAPFVVLRCLVKRQGENLRIGAQNMHFDAPIPVRIPISLGDCIVVIIGRDDFMFLCAHILNRVITQLLCRIIICEVIVGVLNHTGGIVIFSFTFTTSHSAGSKAKAYDQRQQKSRTFFPILHFLTPPKSIKNPPYKYCTVD